MSEASLQIAFINWMRSACPDVMVWHTYNENSVNAIQGKLKKDRGVLAGVHDNCMVLPDSRFCTLELKDPAKPKSANKYSDTQQAFAEKLDKAGCLHACCQNADQIESYIKSLGLVPKYKFPSSLESSKKQMLMEQYQRAMRGLDY